MYLRKQRIEYLDPVSNPSTIIFKLQNLPKINYASQPRANRPTHSSK
jgi:hypothetical protein